MVKLDFKISSGLKNIIGQELITNDNIAVFELVKNSYDAYAKSVHIIFEKTENKRESKLLIIDDGEGMSEDDIKNKWLFVGYSDKKDFEKNTSINGKKLSGKNRFFAGAKGVGRFSCDRLGAKLNLYSRKKGESKIHLLKVDWKKFETDQNEEFQNIDVDYSKVENIDIEGYESDKFGNGTLLEIIELNDIWDFDRLIKLRKYLQRLINPSDTKAEDTFKIELEAEEYKERDRSLPENERINGPIRNFVFEKLGIKTIQIKCNIRNGRIVTELVDKNKRIFEIDEKNEKYQLLHDIKILVFFLNQSAKATFSRLMGVAPLEYGSVFLYKNNFRIHPYGDEGDDWLGLEVRKGQGQRRYFGARDIMGRIELDGAQAEFKEVSSREGVQKTEAYEQLHKLFLEKVLRPLERYVIEAIDWDRENGLVKSSEEVKADSLEVISSLVGKVKTPDTVVYINPDILVIMKEKMIEKVPSLIKNIGVVEKYIKDRKVRKYVSNQLSALKTASKRLEGQREELRQELEKKEKESLFLKKAVSPDKDIVINLNHTIENSSLIIEGILQDLNDEIKKNQNLSKIIPYVDRISIEVQKITTLAGIVSQANFNLKVTTIKKDIVQYISEYLAFILGLKDSKLKLQVASQKIEYEMAFKPLEISIILDNFISNSKKAGANIIFISFSKIDDALHMRISDNGNGVPKSMLNNLFKRGYTTTSGSGIGLYHINSIMESLGGSVKFLGNGKDSNSKGACFELVFKL